MSWGMDEKALGLTWFDEIDDYNASYSFDKTTVWQHEDGTLYWAADSGCSCPMPFESVKSLDDLTPLRNHRDLENLNKHLMEKVNDGRYFLLNVNDMMTTLAKEIKP